MAVRWIRPCSLAVVTAWISRPRFLGSSSSQIRVFVVKHFIHYYYACLT
jgi:hypothetical protein